MPRAFALGTIEGLFIASEPPMQPRLPRFGVRPFAIALFLALPSPGCADDGGGGTGGTTEGDASSNSGGDITPPATGSDTSDGVDATSGTASSESSSTGVPADACPIDCRPRGETCVEGECVACNAAPDPDAACESISAATPVCVDGACVECAGGAEAACDGDTPFCDPVENRCVECLQHDDCESGGCDIFDGVCMPADRVVHVDALNCDAAPGCTVEDPEPCCDLEEALAVPGDELVVLVHSDLPSTEQPLSVGGGRTLVARGVDAPSWSLIAYLDGAALFTIQGDADVYFSRLRIRAEYENTVDVYDGRLHVDASVLRSRDGTHAILAGSDAADVRVVNSVLFADSNFGDCAPVSVQGGRFWATSSTFWAQQATNVVCSPSAEVAVRNSILFTLNAFDGFLVEACDDADVSYSAVTGEHRGEGNQSLGPPQIQWFEGYLDDLHLASDHPALLGHIARWSHGDPTTDRDGDPRDATEGAMGYAGADVPQ